MSKDLRRRQRVTLLQSVPGQAAGKRIFIKDISVNGFMVAHQEPLAKKGDAVRVEFEWEGRVARFDCELRWTHVQRVGRASYARTLYHSGCRIIGFDDESAAVIREILEHHVARALDERKANARGIPPTHVVAVQKGGASEFVRHEYVGDQWRHFATSNRTQPRGGFTVAADLTEDEVQMLREAWVQGDASMREMIRKTAELSIANKDGIPTRRYNP